MANLIENAKDRLELSLIGLNIRAKNTVRRFFSDETGIVEKVIIIAIFAALAIAVATLIGKAVKGRADDAVDAINGFETIGNEK